MQERFLRVFIMSQTLAAAQFLATQMIQVTIMGIPELKIVIRSFVGH
jgi:hypothetical protein